MSADTLLSRLQGVKKTGRDRWIALCPAHGDRHPSLSVALSDKNPELVLVRCHALCAIEDILAAVGLSFDALFPERAVDHRITPLRRPFFPTDVFEIALREITIASVIACDMHANRAVSEIDYARLLTVCGRLNDISGAAYGK